ncbi:Rpr2-domain-containing protein [Rhodofomes roseus]|uniref:Rpr2-domain-containing protein n=1 Tax=Rhodofomes roseus TaxID=34475 RepID=A0ABQ8KN42_9APHY|nr:Rpr2-domain-containing protein [Rhodofomes roseus]KAH9839226.1 Rpr2-domain-containing protein [Rhodofomes roseus]
MAKKNKGQEPTATLQSVTNRDILQRLNFLYQASAYLNTIAPHAATTKPEGKRATNHAAREELRRKKRHPATTSDLSRNYVASMKAISQKATVKMDPTIKRTICQKCNTVLIPGVTEEVRVRGSRIHGNLVTYACTACGFVRRIPAHPILDPDAPPEPSASGTTPAVRTADVTGYEPEAMDVDVAQPSTSAAGSKQETKKAERPKRRRRKGPQPRLPPLFQRKGHVVFRGNARLESDDAV